MPLPHIPTVRLRRRPYPHRTHNARWFERLQPEIKMTRNRFLLAAALLTVSTQAVAQSTAMIVRPESKVALSGSSNVHDWSCKSSEFQAIIELDSSYQTRPLTEVKKPITRVGVTIPVKSLKCGKGKMDDNMYKALQADKYPEIRYELETYEIDTALTDKDRFAANTVGTLTVAGKTNRVAIPITAVRGENSSMTGEGLIRILMTDYGIKPPVALLGTLRTRDEVDVTFKVLLDKSVVVALTQQ
jgi:hypothetical protein